MNVILLVLLMLLQIGDGFTTYYGLEFTTRVVESNPIMAFLIDLMGTAGAVAVTKAIWFVMAGYLLVNYERMLGWGWPVGLVAFCGLYIYVVINIIQLVFG